MGVARMSDLEAIIGRQNALADSMNTSTAALVARTSHLAQAQTAATIIIGGSQDVVVTWPGDGFPTAEYAVDVMPLALLGKGQYDVVAQDEVSVTVRITASVLIAAGVQFLVYGRN